jgi:hypothetical protein
MINLKKLNKIGFGIFALSFLLLTACELEPGKIDPSTSEVLSADTKNKLSLLDLSKLPEGFENGLTPKLNFGSESARQVGSGIVTDPHFLEMARRAVSNVTASECGPTALDDYLDGQFSDWTNDAFFYAFNLAMVDLPTYDALLYENSSEGQYFGKDGEYSQSLTKTFKDLKRFSDIPSSDIVMVGMHGKMLTDRDKIVRTYISAFGLSPASAEFYADLVSESLALPEFRNGDHPIFTFNAFANTSFIFEGNVIPLKIVMGDGIMEAYTSLGYGDVAPQAILAHEFGHQMQFALGVFDVPISADPAENTRRTELMADAYSAYFLSHARGAAMQWKRVRQFLQVFFTIGDCGFSSPGHHGTPIQRMDAADWGYKLADSAKKQGKILTSQEFVTLFDAALPGLVD